MVIIKLLIAGSRSIDNFDLEKFIPNDTDLIISGGAQGIDLLAEIFADKKKISKLILRPKYNLYGRAAPLKRNEEMVDIADGVLIIWDGKSKGTLHTINYARKKSKILKIIDIKENT